MNITRNEIRTGLLVVLTLSILVVVLLYLGKPGVFISQNTFRIYVDNASGIVQGADVLLAGRKIGQVAKLFSPVPESERPAPNLETRIDVTVAENARVYKDVKVQLTSYSLLGQMLIDFSSGSEASGVAPDGMSFIGTRPAGLSDAVPRVLEAIDPVLKTTTQTLETLQKTADNLTEMTKENGDLSKALAEFRQFGSNLKEMSGDDGPLHKTLNNLETLTGEEGRINKAVENVEELTGDGSDLAKTLDNAEKFTAKLADNADIDKTLANFKQASEKLSGTVDNLGAEFTAVGTNLKEASDTIKRQPWRLIWPSTKKYEDDGRARPPQPRMEIRRAKAVRR